MDAPDTAAHGRYHETLPTERATSSDATRSGSATAISLPSKSSATTKGNDEAAHGEVVAGDEGLGETRMLAEPNGGQEDRLTWNPADDPRRSDADLQQRQHGEDTGPPQQEEKAFGVSGFEGPLEEREAIAARRAEAAPIPAVTLNQHDNVEVYNERTSNSSHGAAAQRLQSNGLERERAALGNDSSTLGSQGGDDPESLTVKTASSVSQESARSRANSFDFTGGRDRIRYSWQSLHDEEPNRPRIHIVKLVSNTASASAGFPGGEALQFSISPAGRRIAAYNSARLYILQTAALPVGVSQDYALKRRPVAVEIVDDGNSLAILADHHTVNIYDLGDQELARIRTLKLDFPTNCIALSRNGGLLAAAYEGGIEIFSLASSALPTDRRAVRSQRMDRMAFSEDSSTLLGTTTRINASSTVIVSVPVFPSQPNGIPTHEELKEAWCSDLLQPENIRNSSHAVYMREARVPSNERLFAWNGLADTFGLLNVADLQYGNVDFPVVISPPLSTCGGLGAAIHSCPAIDEGGDTVAMIVNDRTVRLYIVPTAEDDDTTYEAHSIDHELDGSYGNAFSDIRWVHSSSSLPAPVSHQSQVQGRLIVASPGGVMDPNTNLGMGMTEESIDDIEGGRIIIFDFDPQFIGELGQTFSLTLGRATPQMLDEEEVDVAEEVALMRRRTVNQKKGRDLIHRPVQLGRAATTFGARERRPRGSVLLSYNNQNDSARPLPDLVEDGEAMDAFEQPYQQSAPRSQASLHRSATNVQRHRFQTLEERTRERASVDTSNDVIPLPEYTAEPNAPLPRRYRALAGLDQPAPPPMNVKDSSSGTNNQPTPPTANDTETQHAETEGQAATEHAFNATNNDSRDDSVDAHPTNASLYNNSYMNPLNGQMQRSETLQNLDRNDRHRNTEQPPPSFDSHESLYEDQDERHRDDNSVVRPDSIDDGRSHVWSIGASQRERYMASDTRTSLDMDDSDDSPFPSPTSPIRLTESGPPPTVNADESGRDPLSIRHLTGVPLDARPVWNSGISHGHIRKSSLSTKSAFADTAKAKKLGFFRSATLQRRRQGLPPTGIVAADSMSSRRRQVTSSGMSDTFDTRSRRDGKCALM